MESLCTNNIEFLKSRGNFVYLCVDVSNQSNPMLTSVSGNFDIFVSFSKPSISRISQFLDE